MGVRFRFGTIADGDLAITAVDNLDGRRRRMVDLPWTWLRQVHGNAVVTVADPGDGCGREADAAVTQAPGAALAVHTADCAPVLFWSDDGVVGAAHAGWRGLANGVIEATVRAMENVGAGPIRAMLGPCIGACCYEFGAADLTRLALQFGPDVVSCTTSGQPAFDLPVGVGSACRSVGVDLDLANWCCTACSTSHFSWRARQDHGRQASVVWWEP